MMQPVLFVAEVYDVESQKKKKKSIRSPLFYVGDKYKLMPQLKSYFLTTLIRIMMFFVVEGARQLMLMQKKL